MLLVSEYPTRKRQFEGEDKQEHVPNKKRYNGHNDRAQPLPLEPQQPSKKQSKIEPTMMDEDTTTDEEDVDKKPNVIQTRVSPPVLDCSLKGQLESGWSNGSFHGWHSC